jgi:hypothetical protein
MAAPKLTLLTAPLGPAPAAAAALLDTALRYVSVAIARATTAKAPFADVAAPLTALASYFLAAKPLLAQYHCFPAHPKAAAPPSPPLAHLSASWRDAQLALVRVLPTLLLAAPDAADALLPLLQGAEPLHVLHGMTCIPALAASPASASAERPAPAADAADAVDITSDDHLAALWHARLHALLQLAKQDSQLGAAAARRAVDVAVMLLDAYIEGHSHPEPSLPFQTLAAGLYVPVPTAEELAAALDLLTDTSIAPAASAAISGRGGAFAHLLHVHKHLCECVNSGDAVVRTAVCRALMASTQPLVDAALERA